MKNVKMAILGGIVAVVATPSIALAGPPPEPQIWADCTRTPFLIIAGGKVVLDRQPDPTCLAGSGYDLKLNKKV